MLIPHKPAGSACVESLASERLAFPLNTRDKDQMGESCHDPRKQEACGQFDHGCAMCAEQ